MLKVSVIGTGYVGLVSAACLSTLGFEVSCFDRDHEKINQLQQGDIPFYEPGLKDLIAKQTKEHRLIFSDHVVHDADIVFIAVGTPLASDNQLDISNIYEAVDQLVPTLNGSCVIVLKSTVPFGTNKKVSDYISANYPEANCDVVSNPEFLKAGSAIDDFLRPDRIVLGSNSLKALSKMEQIYQYFTQNNVSVIKTTPESAEVIKLAANSFLATKLSFINELSDFCERSGADIKIVSEGLGYDDRIGSKYLSAGPGFGGSCLKKDATSLVSSGVEKGASLTVVQAALKANQNRKSLLYQRVLSVCKGSVKNKKIAILGLTFKNDTDDMRESPSLDLIPKLQEGGAIITAFDPKGYTKARSLLSGINIADTEYQVLEQADIAVFLTDWSQFPSMDLNLIRQKMAGNIIVDLRNLFKPVVMNDFGFQYYSLGS